VSDRSIDVDFTWAILIFFFLLWQQNGWYRIDCSLGVQKACELIASEKEYQGEVK
jgi:hypothetical protein